MCRGGGGGSVSWHQDGTMRNKINSIYDFVACGNYLVMKAMLVGKCFVQLVIVQEVYLLVQVSI